MAVRFGRAASLAATAALAAACCLTACSGGPAGQVDYAVDGALSTYNTNTVLGAASGGPQAFARVLTGFDYHGPDGQAVGDRDFGSVSVVGRAPLVLDYQINDAAVYSDGKPITCDDMVLAWAAQSGRFAGFDAANQAGYRDVASVDCTPGQKKARVTFAQDRSFVDFGQLFAATSMMPAHVLSDDLGIGDGGITKAVQSGDAATLERVATAWNTRWNLSTDVDLKRFPSSGPYKLAAVTEDGAVALVANDKWWGAKPLTAKITVWPRGADIQERVNDKSYDVVDVAAGSTGTLNLPEGYVRTDTPSGGVEQLIFSARGPLADPAARRAVALCTPRDVIARNAGVAVADARLMSAAEDSITAAETVAEGGQFGVANPEAAREAIGGRPLTVRVGYQRPNARLAAMIGMMATSCAPAGITVVDSSSDVGGPQALRDDQIDVLVASTGGATGSGSSGSSSIDAYDLHSGNGNNLSGYANEQVDGVIGAMAVTQDPKELSRLLGQAAPLLWRDVPTLPLYRQQRTLVTAKTMYAVSSNPTRWGAGWNMDRWELRR